MKNSILRVLGLAFGLALLVQPVAAFAYSDEPQETETITIGDVVVPASALADIAEEVVSVQPTTSAIGADTPSGGGSTATLTPDGTGSVVDNVTDEDGKEFYTITTEAGNVFYLVIDTQRGAENVYFLNAVTENDLLALAATASGESGIETPAEPEPVAPPADDPGEVDGEEEAPAEQPKSNSGTHLLVVLVVAVGGGAGYYFKVLRPKQQLADDGEDEYVSEYEEPGSDDPYTDYDPEAAEAYETGANDLDDAPPWDDDSEGEDE